MNVNINRTVVNEKVLELNIDNSIILVRIVEEEIRQSFLFTCNLDSQNIIFLNYNYL